MMNYMQNSASEVCVKNVYLAVIRGEKYPKQRMNNFNRQLLLMSKEHL